MLNQGDVASYDYGGYSDYTARGTGLDGVSCTFSACTVAGDFDGDGKGKDEFAVIWRDNLPNEQQFADTMYNYYCGYFGYSYRDVMATVFVGFTGKIHVKTYKWNGSSFQTEEDVRAFDSLQHKRDDSRLGMYYHEWNYAKMPLAVKAAVGDFDGDGRDDIAVLRVTLHYTEYFDHKYMLDSNTLEYTDFAFGAFVDWYTFDAGNIKPKYNGPSDTCDNRNGWVGLHSTTSIGIPLMNLNQTSVRQRNFLLPLTGEDKPYPVIDREFDIIAGKFTGKIGAVTTCDELIIKYPQWADGDVSGNKLRSHVALMTNILGVTNGGTEVHEIMSLSDREHLLAFAKGDLADETVKLGEPVKTVDRSDLDYTAILQMMPYHVDNIESDGSALTKQPQNFTLNKDTQVTYKNTTSDSEKKSMTYSMTTTAETIFALDSSFTQGAAKTFQGIRGITSTLFGSTPAGKAIEGIGKFWDSLKDTTTTTQSKSNENESSQMMQVTTQANYIDTLYVNTSNRYIWRYPIDNPPSWILDQTLSSYGAANPSNFNKKQTYITFAMSEPAIPTAAKGTRDSHYQPYHEPGNLFSYPSALAEIEGYEGHKSLLSGGSSAARRWDGTYFKETIDFTSSQTNQNSTQKTNKAGAITKFLSAVDNIFGSSFAHIPYDTVSSFTRNVTDKESITVTIPGSGSNAEFTAVFEPYLDVTGATTVAFAVESFRTIDALWGPNSLYSRKPDPSFLLPEKFNYSLKNDSVQYEMFEANDNDPTALLGRGIRYTIADHDIESNNLLMNGLKYKIKIPVYNASFVDADNFKVRLSYSKELKYNAHKVTIGEYTFSKLHGWEKGKNRQYAEFEWTPDITQGVYYLYAEIDPEHKIAEVHEDRRDSSNKIIDYGGNNMAYFKIGIANTDQVPFDRTQLETQYGGASAAGAGKFAAADLVSSDFPYVEWVKVNGKDFEDFIKSEVDGAIQHVPAEVEVKYAGEYLMTDVALVGYALKAESASKDVSEINDSDIGLVFMKEHFAMFPEEDHKVHFSIDPSDLENGVGFLLRVYGVDYPLTDIIHGSSGTNTGVSSSSSGCESFAGSMAGVLALILIMKKRTR